jgi:starvation-inducible outer membrane lipoprotein
MQRVLGMWLLMACAIAPAFLGVAGCTSTVVPQALLGQVDRGITYPELAQNPEAFMGRLILMGGVVLGVEPRGQDLHLTVAERPLSTLNEAPVLYESSRGDLLLQVPGGGAAAYRQGNLITFVGSVLGRAPEAGLPPVPRIESRYIYVW